MSAERDSLATLRPNEPELREGPEGAAFLYELLPDWAGQPAGLLRTPVRQDISATARRTGRALVAALGLAALALLLGGAYLRTRPERAAAAVHGSAAWGAAALVVFTGLTLTYGLFAEWRQRSQDDLVREFRSAAAEQTERVRTVLQRSLEQIDTVRLFFEGVDQVSRQQFRDFVSPILERHPLQALEWLPRVPQARRAAYESAARRDGLQGFQFTELDAQGRLVRAADRAEYFPVFYLEPPSGNAMALGFAPGPGHPARGAALEQARDLGRMAATGRYILVQEPEPGQHFSVLVFAPVYDGRSATQAVEERRARLRGFVLGVIRIGDAVRDALRTSEPGQLTVRLLDLSADHGKGWLHDHVSSADFEAAATAAEWRFQRDFELADRRWRVEVAPTATFLARHRDPGYRWIPAAGATLTLLGALYLFALVAQRQRAERLVAARTAELQASEERYRVVALMTGQMIYDYDCASGRIRWAGATEALTGQDAMAFAAVDIDAWAARIHPEDRPDALERLHKAMAAGARYAVEYRFARGDGTYCWIADHGEFLLDGQGKAIRMLGAMEDVTEYRQAAAALEARQAQLRALIDAMPDIVCFKDGGGRWLEANAFAVRLFGLEGVDYLGKTDSELAGYKPSSGAAHRQCEETDELAWQRGEPTRSDEHIPHPDGTEHTFDVIKIPRFDDRGQRHSLLVVGRDVTERQRAEQALRQSEDKFAKVFATTPNVIVISRQRDGLLLDVNPGFEAITGYSRSEAVGRSTLELDLWADPAERDRMVSELRRSGQVLYRDFSFRRKDGATRAGQFSARPVPIDHEPCLLFVMHDVTERREAEAELRLRDRLLQATADALTQLLSGRSLDETVGAALATLGQAVAADRAYVFENHADPATGAPLMSQRHEWCAAAALPQIANPALQDVSYDAHCPRWHATLAAGAAITGLVREFPDSERAALEPQGIRSLLVLPIRIEERFWGFIGFDDCHSDRVWSASEQAILRTAAAAIGDATLRLRAEAALRASEEQYRTLVGNLNIGVYRNTSGPQGRFLQANPAIIQMFGYASEAEFLQLQVSDLYVDPEERSRFIAEVLSQGQVTNKVLHLRRRDGRTFWGAATARVAYDEQGQVRWLDGVIEDITARRQAEQRQRLAAAVFEAAREAIFVADADGAIVAINPAFTTLTGYTEAAVRGRSPRLLWAERQPEGYFEAMAQTAAREGAWQGEFPARRQDGERRLAFGSLCVVRDPAGRITHYVGIATDITAQKAAEQRIERLAYYDVLTSLPNRALLAQRAELAQAMAARHGGGLAVLMLDLDRFKEVNDAFGHGAGDTLLAQVAARLQALVRAEDTVCRLGGDEFVLLLPEADQDGALRVADKVLAALRQPLVVAEHTLNATASVGIALYPHDGADFAELLKNADVALYRAKHAGRNTCVFYDRAMNAASLARMVLEAELRQALAAGQLRAYYQPKVRLADGALAGAEALVRWEHPERGLILPGQFVPVAEASDLIVALGDWMLAEVCRQLASWRRQGAPALTVAVNLAARHFRQPGLADRIGGLLAACDLPAQALELELTESALLDASAKTVETLRRLETLGIGLAIDDFGTGYSSLGYLKHLPLTALKIDREFVRDLVTDSDDRAIAATIVALGHHLELAVVAEGVETEDQRRLLIEQGCDLAQGYLFDRPLPAEAFAAAWLAPARPPSD